MTLQLCLLPPVRDLRQQFHDLTLRSMTTHWRTTQRDDARLRPAIACDESIVVPAAFQPTASAGEPTPEPGRAYGTPAGTVHIQLTPEDRF